MVALVGGKAEEKQKDGKEGNLGQDLHSIVNARHSFSQALTIRSKPFMCHDIFSFIYEMEDVTTNIIIQQV